MSIRSGLKTAARVCYCIVKTLMLFLLLFNTCAAGDLLEQINNRLAKSTIIQGDFHQEKRLKILRKPLISEGVFTYHQSKGVIWKTLSPVTSLLLVNNAHLLTAQGEQAVPPTFGRVFQAMLGGDLHQLHADFLITGINEEASWRLELQPKDKLVKKIINMIELSGDSELRTLEIQEFNGNISIIKFSHINHPAQLTTEQQSDFARLSP
jgi:outer membrane lipoprotein-sorting protein